VDNFSLSLEKAEMSESKEEGRQKRKALFKVKAKPINENASNPIFVIWRESG